jgi:hypothetical protein
MKELNLKGEFLMKRKKDYYKVKAENVIKHFKKRNIAGYYAKDSAAAKNKVLELIEENSSISWGGSMTLKEIEIFDELKSGNYKLIDRATAKTPEEKEKIYHQALSADYYLMSSNAITQTGKLVNIDGTGNRLAALIYGPKNVIIVAGINKISSDEESAIKRVNDQAAPANAIRLDKDTPCTRVGYCTSCHVDDTICCHTVTTRYSHPDGRIKVILVGEKLGY